MTGIACLRVSALMFVVLSVAPRSLASNETESGRGVTSDGGTAAGKESYKSDLFTGAMTLSVPIKLPPGTNGLQPNLLFSYNSGTGFTWVGRGWDLSIPEIRRMTRFGVPKYDDNPATGDLFSLGDDRLVRDDAGVYRKMRDDFARISRTDSSGSIAYWTVQTKDGMTETYGGTADSRVVNPITQKTFRWLLSRAQDANGNFIRYEYYTPGAPDVDNSYPKLISYSFRGDESASSPTIRTVAFSLNAGERTDKTVSYIGGFESRLGKRLESVVVSVGTSLVSRYDVVYLDEDGLGPRNGRSLVHRFTITGADGSSTLPADTYRYSDSASVSWASDPTVAAALSQLRAGSVTGMDLSQPDQWRFLDVNGDGAPDVVATAGGTIGVFINTKRNTDGIPLFLPSGTAPLGTPTYRPPTYLGGPSITYQGNPYHLGAEWVDYNGDGRLDVFVGARDVDSAYASFSTNYRNSGHDWQAESVSGYANPPAYLTTTKMSCVASGYDYIYGKSRLVDLNGDGLLDIVENKALDSAPCDSHGLGTVNVYLNNGYGWDPRDTTWSDAIRQRIVAFNNGVGLQALIFVDLNGDGLPDVASQNANPVAYLNTGTGFASNATALPGNVADDEPLVDLDGDGIVDFLNGAAWLGTGVRFAVAPFDVPVSFPDGDVALVDLDGDGLVDLVEQYHYNHQLDVRFATMVAPPDYLIAIDKAEGGQVGVTYAATGDGSCRDSTRGGCNGNVGGVSWPTASLPSGACRYPLFLKPGDSSQCLGIVETLPFPVQSVSKITTNDRNGNISSETFVRDAGLYDPAEREFRGFGQVLERPQTLTYPDPRGSNTSINLGVLRFYTFYQQSFLRGAMATSALYASADDVLDSSDSLLHLDVNQFAVTRGDANITLLVQPGIATSTTCDVNLQDLLNPAGGPAGCSLVDLEQSPYLSAVTLLAPFPYAAFRSQFQTVSNRDRSFAYLVLGIGSASRDVDGGTSTDGRIVRWHDQFGNVQGEWNWGDVSDLSDDRFTLTEYAAPDPSGAGPSNLHSLMSLSYRMSVAPDPTHESATAVYYSAVGINYDSQNGGSVQKGNATGRYSTLLDPVRNNLDTSVETVFQYPPQNYGLPNLVTDAREGSGAVPFTTIGYDASQTFPISSTRGGLHKTLTYDPPGAPRGMGIVYQATDENGNVTASTADPFGRPLKNSGPTPIRVTGESTYTDFAGFDPNTARVTNHTYDGTGADLVSKSYTDGFGRTIRTQRNGLGPGDTPTTIVQTTQYDLQGHAAYTSRPFSGTAGTGTTTLYDQRGRTRFVIQPDGAIAETQRVGLTTTMIDTEGRRTQSRTNGAGSVVEVKEFDGAQVFTTRYAYDSLGRNVAVCDALSGATPCTTTSDSHHTKVTTFDSMDRAVRIADPDRGPTTTRFDGRGAVLRTTDARGISTRFDYDGTYGRLKSEDYGDDGTNDVVYLYGDENASPPPNSRGRPYQVTEPGGVSTRLFDPRGLPIQELQQFSGISDPYTASKTYDWMGRVRTVTYPDGEVVTTTYDAMGVDRIASPTRTYVAEVENNPEGALSKVVYGNGDVRDYSFEAATGRVSAIHGHHGTSSDFLNLGYAYDHTGYVTSIQDPVTPSESLSALHYDGLSRLIDGHRGTVSLQYGYDAIGNLINKEGTIQPYGSSKPHAIFDPANPTRWAYDPAGNLVARSGQGLAYDAVGSLQSVTPPSAGIATTFLYSASGQRMLKRHGADVSAYMGPDIEIKNKVRFVKTIRLGRMIVAQVSTQPGAGAAVTPPTGFGEWGPMLEQAPLLLLLAALALLVAAAVATDPAMVGETAAWRQLLSMGLVGLIAMGPIVPGLALAASKGDLNADGKIDAADVLLAHRAASGEISLSPDAQTAGDVAPFGSGTVIGDGAVNEADVEVLLRSIAGEDVDGDGLTDDVELQLGFSPFSRDTNNNGISDGDEDSDADGWSDAYELAQGTDPLKSDTDGDGYVDSQDPDPKTPAGTLLHWVHGDHLGGTAVLTDASGTVVRRTFFGIWGEIRLNVKLGPPSTPDPGEKFTGQRFDVEIGLSYFGSRYYDASTGRFTSADTASLDPYKPQGLNLYAYGGNNALNFVDPTGHMPIDVSSNSYDLTSTYNPPDYGISNYDNFSPAYSGFYNDTWDTVGSIGGSSQSYASTSTFDTLIGDSYSSSIPSSTFMCCSAATYSFDQLTVNPRTYGYSDLSMYMGAADNAYWSRYVPAPDPIEPAMFGVEAALPFVGLPGRLAAEGIGGLVAARELGQAGEAAVRAAYEIGPATRIFANGAARIPDGLTRTALSEVKNTAYQPFTRQLRDYAKYAADNKLRFDLFLRPGAKISSSLFDAEAAGDVNLLDIPP